VTGCPYPRFVHVHSAHSCESYSPVLVLPNPQHILKMGTELVSETSENLHILTRLSAQETSVSCCYYNTLLDKQSDCRHHTALNLVLFLCECDVLRAVKHTGIVEVKLHSFITSAPDANGQLHSLAALLPRRAPNQN
jgi:hypothetical protein